MKGGGARLRRVLLAAAVAACSTPVPRSAAPVGVAPAGAGADTLPVLIAAGDIGDCSSPGDEATARLLDSLPGTIAVLGDNAYPFGTDANYANCYDPTWGRHRARTRPTPGNHEYYTSEAGGYFRYFGAAAGERGKGWYSYDLAGWHVVVLNSNSGCREIRCDARSEQVRWLRADLAAHPARCTLAYWHHPRFNSGGRHGDDARVSAFWDVLYEHGVDVILNGHEHLYERFAPQRPDATADAERGIRQFTVGTGGTDRYGFGRVQANSEVRNDDTFGVLRLDLEPDGYRWRFLAVGGGTFADSGSARCH